MKAQLSSLFDHSDRLQLESLNQRLMRNMVINSNVANAETPGYRALGYDFEEQLQSVAEANNTDRMKTSEPTHFRNAFTLEDGSITPEVYVDPTESVGQDGNTVDLDKQMSMMAQNQILYRTAAESLNRKMGLIRYAINGGR